VATVFRRSGQVALQVDIQVFFSLFSSNQLSTSVLLRCMLLSLVLVAFLSCFTLTIPAQGGGEKKITITSVNMFSSPYLPHAIYAIALTSISIHLVNQRRTSEEDKSRVNAQISILESVRDQLRSDKPLSNDELARLKKLASAPLPEEEKPHIRWSDIFMGRKPVVGKESDVSEWDKRDMETREFQTTFYV
jgi:hypothetical protein